MNSSIFHRFKRHSQTLFMIGFMLMGPGCASVVKSPPVVESTVVETEEKVDCHKALIYTSATFFDIAFAICEDECWNLLDAVDASNKSAVDAYYEQCTLPPLVGCKQRAIVFHVQAVENYKTYCQNGK